MSFARHGNAASQRVWTTRTGVLPDLEAIDLVLTVDHLCRCIGGMVRLVHIVGGIHIKICSVSIHKIYRSLLRSARITSASDIVAPALKVPCSSIASQPELAM
jgi:hypothetical protein